MRFQSIFSLFFVSITVFVVLTLANAADDSGDWVFFRSAPVKENSLLLSGYLYKPEGQGPFPAVIILHGCAGVDWHHKNWAKQLTEWGYVALIIDSFSARSVRDICQYVWQVTPTDRVSDILSGAYYLQQLNHVDGNRIGILGFSNGAVAGLKAIQKDVLPLSNMESYPIKAAVLFYPWCNATTDHHIKVPTLLHIGKDDDWTQSYRCVDLMNQLYNPKMLELIVHEGAYHAFDRPKKKRQYLGHTLEYNPTATHQALEKTKEFFSEHLLKNNLN